MNKNRLKYYIAFLTQLILVSNCLAQIELKGYVYDGINMLPLAGANIYEENTSNGIISDYSGKFKLVVNDSSTVRISFIGFEDVTINAADYKGDTIFLEEDKNVIIDYFYANSYFVGYYGDWNKYPYGISLYHMRPYLFHRLVKLSGQLNYKTDFKSNYDFQFILKKTELINLNRYQLSASTSFRKREFEELDINDYEVVLSNYIDHRFSLIVGYAMKEDFSLDYKRNNGAILGLSKFFNKTMTFISSDITIFEDFYEYDITVLQRISHYKKFWSNLKFGVEYQNYKDYDEFNIIARYRFSR